MKQKKRAYEPHDGILKTALSYPEVARDFMQHYLPSWLLLLCNLKTLQIESGEYTDKYLHKFYSDVVCGMKSVDGKNHIKILIEHQSGLDRFIASRMMRYAMAAFHRHRRAGYKSQPWVIPVLYYNGRRSPYPRTTNWLHESDNPELLARVYGSGSCFPLVDITVIPDEEILTHGKMAALTFLQKHVRIKDLALQVGAFVAILQRNPLPLTLEKALINYTMAAGDTADVKAFTHQLVQQLPHYKEEIMTWAEELRREGRQQGRMEGIEQGIEQGIEKGRSEGERSAALKIALAMLRSGIDSSTVLKTTGLTNEDLVQINH